MSNTNQQRPPPQPRRVYLLQATYSTNNAKLDFRSHLFLKWADKWTASAGGLKAPHSGLIRRALSLYSKHLESLSPSEVAGELQSIKAACTGTSTPLDEQDAAEARMAAVVVGSPLPSFEVVLKGQYAVDEAARLMKHLEQFNDIPAKKVKPSHE